MAETCEENYEAALTGLYNQALRIEALEAERDPAATTALQHLLRDVTEARAELHERIEARSGIGLALEKAKAAELTALAWLLENQDRVIVMCRPEGT